MTGILPRAPDDGFAIGDILGLEACFEAGSGEDGAVFFLEDGRVMKVTRSRTEAAIALGIMEAQYAGEYHPSVPYVAMVAMHTCEADLVLPDATVIPHTYVDYVIVRDDMGDLADDEDDPYWYGSLRRVGRWYADGCVGTMPTVPDEHRGHIESALDGMRWIQRHTGAILHDLKPSNLGIAPSGYVGMRDFGRSHDVREDLLRDVTEGRIPTTHEMAEAGPRP